MCFSASASFTAGALLTPIGLYSLNKAYHGNRRLLVLAAFPLLFGVQQAIEGGLWLAIDGQVGLNTYFMALGFTLFAFFIWPFVVPLAALCVERDPLRQRILICFTFVGALFGASLYLPLLLDSSWLSVELVKGSILYKPILIYDRILPRGIVRLIYAIIVGLPLLFSSMQSLRTFGVLIWISVVVSAAFFAYAFVSIWCFFAAVLSMYVVYMVLEERQSFKIKAGAGENPT